MKTLTMMSICACLFACAPNSSSTTMNTPAQAAPYSYHEIHCTKETLNQLYGGAEHLGRFFIISTSLPVAWNDYLKCVVEH